LPETSIYTKFQAESHSGRLVKATLTTGADEPRLPTYLIAMYPIQDPGTNTLG